MCVRDWLASKFGEEMVNNGGLKVTTTLDLDLQEFVQKTVTDEISNLKKFKPQKMYDLLHIPISPGRAKCALLGFTTLQKALKMTK